MSVLLIQSSAYISDHDIHEPRQQENPLIGSCSYRNHHDAPGKGIPSSQTANRSDHG